MTGRTEKSDEQFNRLEPLTRRVFLMEFISEFILIYPFYAIMFGQRGGVSAAGLGMLLATWYIVSVVSEVPTGVLADKMSKKWALVIGKTMQATAFGLWLLIPNFTGYLLGFVVWGIGEAFTSGAFEAYLYESLSDKSKRVFGKIYARTSSMSMLAYVLAYLIGFALGPRYDFLLIMSVLASLFAVMICLTLPDKRGVYQSEIRPGIIKSAVSTLKRSPALRQSMLAAILLMGMGRMLFEYLPVYYHQVGAPIRWVALLLAVGSGMTVLLYWWMHHVEAQLQRYGTWILAAGTLLFVLSFGGGTMTAIIAMLLFTRLIRVLVVNNEAQIQHLATSAARATIGSLYSFAAKLVSGGVITLIGWFAVNNILVTPLRWSVIILVLALTLMHVYFLARKRLSPEQAVK